MTRHDEDIAALADGYVLGTLSEAEAQRFVRHAADCPECAAIVSDLTAVGEAMARALPQQAPPPGLRDRVIANAIAQPQSAPTTVAPAIEVRARRGVPVWFAAAATIVAVIASTLAWQYRQEVQALLASGTAATERITALEQQVQLLRTERTTAEHTGSVLTASDLRRVELAPQPSAPNAAGRVFWSPTHGLVFAATNLPPLPPGRVYQLWIVADAPISAGIARHLGAGFNVNAPPPGPTPPTPKAFALTVEPEGGSPAPTSAMFLLGSNAP